jgi:hypothetical protein
VQIANIDVYYLPAFSPSCVIITRREMLGVLNFLPKEFY